MNIAVKSVSEADFSACQSDASQDQSLDSLVMFLTDLLISDSISDDFIVVDDSMKICSDDELTSESADRQTSLSLLSVCEALTDQVNKLD
ncbi:hypothetical protein EMCG_02043 [[Emmonsia] crescens]|uniref:Uncharacterized protein n=1 Tax=[Emmonsia] crescens TaxID=73230 RepID=A0A0G2HZV1_9EURO|nr:hypothetical protein EMCG_02043 [Emmonsia crescens UAMH 3008]